MTARAVGAARPAIQSVRRTARLLRALADGRGGMGVVELARELSLPSPTVHGLLRTLELEGLVEREPESGRYQIGPDLLAIGFGYLQTSRLQRAARNAAHTLAASTGESVRVGLLHRGRVLIVHHVLGAEALGHALDVGALQPAQTTALGRALLAQEEAAQRGWASAIEQSESGVAAIAAPVRGGPAGTTGGGMAESGAIGIDGPVRRLCVDGAPRPELVRAVLESARTVSRELGGDPW